MKITIICGSQRINSESLRISQYIQELISKKVDVYLLDLADSDFPRLHSYQATNDESWRLRWADTSQELADSDGFIIVSPEWNGGATPTVKNFFLLCSNFELCHKPALIVTTSSGHGGANVVTELRGFTYKNTNINYIPEHIIIRDCSNICRDHNIVATDSKADIYIKKRLIFATDLLINYSTCLKPLRAKSIPQFELSPFGMS